MKTVAILIVIFALSTCWATKIESESTAEGSSEYSQTDIHHFYDAHVHHHHRYPSYDSYHGYSLHPHSIHRSLAHRAYEEPCYPAPCSGIHRRAPKQFAPTVVQVPYPVPIYKNKLRVVKVRMGGKKGVDNRKYLLKVAKPPVYSSSNPRCNNTIVEADKRALAQINAKINDRRRALDRHDHWLLDAKRAVEIVKNELAHTEMKKELVRNQVQDLVNIRHHWTTKLRQDELKWDIEQAQRTLLQLNDHKEILQAHAEDVRKKFAKEAKTLAKLNEHLKALPTNNLDLDDLQDF